MLGIVISLLVDVASAVGCDFLAVALGGPSWSPGRGTRAAVWLILTGVVLGLLTGLWYPKRILWPSPIPGTSLVVLPIVVGLSMSVVGAWRTQRGQRISRLATWYGGASFGLGLALGRFILVAGTAS